MLLKRKEIYEAVRSLDEYIAGDSKHIDFEKYAIVHNPEAPEEERIYTGWTFSLCFNDDAPVGSYWHLRVNTPEEGCRGGPG